MNPLKTTVKKTKTTIVVLISSMSLYIPSVFAAGGEMPSLVHDIGISLLTAGVLAILFARLKIPSIAAFLIAGILIGPIGLKLVTDPVNIDTIAQLGFILLLFLIGLEIDFKKILYSGKTIIVSGLLQYPLTILFGIAAVKLMIWIGIGGSLLASSEYAAIYIGVIIAGSSTMLVVKLFQEHFELDTEPGRLTLGILIFQDIWMIVAILIQPNIENPEIGPIMLSFLGIAILSVFAAVTSKTVVNRAFHWIAKTPELTLMGALAWCFAVVFVGINLDTFTEKLFGINLHMAVDAGMGALIAGAGIANLPHSTEIITKVSTVKDFFITLFFVALGVSIPAPESMDVIILAVAIAVVAILARQFVFFPLFYFSSVDQRTAQVSSTRLAQISVFALVIAFLGVKLGHISPALSSAVIFAFVITALTTPMLYNKAYDIHGWIRPLLEKFGFKAPPELKIKGGTQYKLALLGFFREASSLLHNMERDNPELLKQTLVVDFNVSLHDDIAATGATVKYGDLSNKDTLHHLGLAKTQVIVCTIPDDVLRGITNSSLVKLVREMAPSAVIIANSVSLEEVENIYQAGADYVYMARLEAAEALGNAINQALENRIDVYRERHMDRHGHHDSRKEVMR
jgi:Kef-type K+ transport system membrane component KefB